MKGVDVKESTDILYIILPCAILCFILIICIIICCCKRKNKQKQGHFDANMSTVTIQQTYHMAGEESLKEPVDKEKKYVETLYVQPRLDLDEKAKPLEDMNLELTEPEQMSDPGDLEQGSEETLQTGITGAAKQPMNSVQKPGKNVLYLDQQLLLLVVFLESLDEVVLTVKEGRNFAKIVEPIFVQVVCTKADNTVEIQETGRCIARVSPVWNEHLSFQNLPEEDLNAIQFRVTVLAKRWNKWKEVGCVILGSQSSHVTGKDQWARVLAKNGIVPAWHTLAKNMQ